MSSPYSPDHPITGSRSPAQAGPGDRDDAAENRRLYHGLLEKRDRVVFVMNFFDELRRLAPPGKK